MVRLPLQDLLHFLGKAFGKRCDRKINEKNLQARIRDYVSTDSDAFEFNGHEFMKIVLKEALSQKPNSDVIFTEKNVTTSIQPAYTERTTESLINPFFADRTSNLSFIDRTISGSINLACGNPIGSNSKHEHKHNHHLHEIEDLYDMNRYTNRTTYDPMNFRNSCRLHSKSKNNDNSFRNSSVERLKNDFSQRNSSIQRSQDKSKNSDIFKSVETFDKSVEAFDDEVKIECSEKESPELEEIRELKRQLEYEENEYNLETEILKTATIYENNLVSAISMSYENALFIREASSTMIENQPKSEPVVPKSFKNKVTHQEKYLRLLITDLRSQIFGDSKKEGHTVSEYFESLSKSNFGKGKKENSYVCDDIDLLCFDYDGQNSKDENVLIKIETPSVNSSYMNI